MRLSGPLDGAAVHRLTHLLRRFLVELQGFLPRLVDLSARVCFVEDRPMRQCLRNSAAGSSG